MRPITPTQRQCMIEATIDPLLFRRRGFARTKTGTFYSPQTVHALIKRGDLRFIRNGRQVLVTARAA
jgi:hypothetical protein